MWQEFWRLCVYRKVWSMTPLFVLIRLISTQDTIKSSYLLLLKCLWATNFALRIVHFSTENAWTESGSKKTHFMSISHIMSTFSKWLLFGTFALCKGTRNWTVDQASKFNNRFTDGCQRAWRWKEMWFSEFCIIPSLAFGCGGVMTGLSRRSSKIVYRLVNYH